ncbi:hypothetical protein FHX40_1482 [Thermopolyspora flexuosa]|uniref:Ig-like domain-containing protein n=2 Tax=Thermopolyspora flexuosa TaxID=103836 RepID=A0A543IW47_9ACTN|nr:hypothetical protein FHX40_1482 [Thermopolyspora flexuosa]
MATRMLRRITTVVATVAVGSVTLVTAPAAAATVGAPKAPTITSVVVQPNPVVVPSEKRVTVTFSFVTGNDATEAEAYLKPPAPSVETKITLTKRNLGFGKAQWTATHSFDRSAKPGSWNLRVYAKNSGGDASGNKSFEVRQVWKTAFTNFDARPRLVREGDRIRLDGRLQVETAGGGRKALAGERVHIAFRPLGGRSWVRVDSTRTRRDGGFGEFVRATRSGWYRAEYDGSKTTHPAKSEADRVTVKPRELATRISDFDVAPRSVAAGGKVTVTGRLQAADGRGWDGVRGRRVDIFFQEKGSGEWVRVGSDRTDRFGRFRERITAKAPGWWRAVFDGGRGLKGSESRVVWVAAESKADTRIVRFDAFPEPVRFGRFLNFRGKLQVLDGKRWVPFDRQKVRLYFKADGRRKWELVKDARTGRDGGFALRERAFRSGWWRVVFAGDARTEEAVARPDHVRVVRR